MIKVLIVDDSAVIRRMLSAELSRIGGIEVIGTARDAYDARDKVLALRPDVLTLDIDMPKIDGLTFLAKLMKHYPMPVVVISSMTPSGSEQAVRALALGAIDVVPKPAPPHTLADLTPVLVEKIRTAAQAHLPRRTAPAVAVPAGPRPVAARSLNRVLALGASTGGTEALRVVLSGLPATTCGTVIVQHMPEPFMKPFAARLSGFTAMDVRVAEDDDALVPGVALIAPGNRHMVLVRRGSYYHVCLRDGPEVHHQRPAVDVLFYSVAQEIGAAAIGVLLTGMGVDGARGLLAMRSAGAMTVAQDEKSSVVFGMPKEAIALGAAQDVLPLDQVSGRIIQLMAESPVMMPR
jgi:two-component system chemotaxis response regulator CheB